jgi:glycosyltransferase involved in cell wall biosynthesis
VAKAVAQVRAAVPDLLWCVIGDGPERGRLEQLVVENKAQDSVMWLGAVFEEAALAPWFLSATVMVHPSGIGLSLMKAFGYGVPVITHGNEKNQMPEYAALVDGKNGLTFAEGSVEDLSEKLLFLLKDEALRRRLSEHARETVRRHYNTAVMAQRFVTLLDKVR